MRFSHNLIGNQDNYKHCHYPLYPPGTEYISSYIESRGGVFPATQFFGLQAYIREYLMTPITLDDIDEAEFVLREQGMHFNRENWLGILEDHDGFLPVEIEAVPEGLVVPSRNVLVQIINTDPKYYWATSFFETALLRAVWYPCTIGTVSWMCKQILNEALDRTSDVPDGYVRGMFADYGARGVSSLESAALGGMAHLVNFCQGGTVTAQLAAKHFYNAVDTVLMSGPNSEHAGFMAWGRENEAGAIRNMLDVFRSAGFALVLTDTYDHEHCVKNIIGGELKSEIQNFPGLVGIRPDSGDLVQVTADTTEWLLDAFGGETNSKGYRILPPFIRVVQGDGMTLETLPLALAELERRGLAADNVVFAMGGGLLQRWNRDTMNFGQKASAVCVNGTWQDIAKSPVGSPFKKSKGGRLALQRRDGEYLTVPKGSIPESENVLEPVFRNGKLLRMHHFNEVRANAETPVPRSWYEDFARQVHAEQAVPVNA
jgi:nicotinamide phosphoribosyltransferase